MSYCSSAKRTLRGVHTCLLAYVKWTGHGDGQKEGDEQLTASNSSSYSRIPAVADCSCCWDGWNGMQAIRTGLSMRNQCVPLRSLTVVRMTLAVDPDKRLSTTWTSPRRSERLVSPTPSVTRPAATRLTVFSPISIRRYTWATMVKSTIIVRASDALPLAATVDDEQVKRVLQDRDRAMYMCLPTLCID